MRASGRVLEKSHVSILGWEQRMATQQLQWSPLAAEGASLGVEGDEVYPHWARTFSPSGSKG